MNKDVFLYAKKKKKMFFQFVHNNLKFQRLFIRFNSKGHH